MPTIICSICGYVFNTELLQMELYTGGHVVRDCPNCKNKIKTKINRGS